MPMATTWSSTLPRVGTKTRISAMIQRVALIITDPGNPYRYLEIRGRAVEVPGSAADEHLDRMARKYFGTQTYTYKQPGEVRVMYKIQAERVNGFSFPHAEHLSP
jgi:hypothetical protein